MSVWSLMFLAVTVTTSLTSAEAKTVLFYPPPVASYIVYHSEIAVELATFNHDVWICVPHYISQKGVIKDTRVNVIEYGEDFGDITAKLIESTKILDRFWAGEPMQELKAVYTTSMEFMKISSNILANETFVNRVRSLKPDLIVLESMPFNLNMLVLPYMLDIPFALIGTAHDIVLSKVPFSPAAPVFPSGRISDKLSFFQRLQSVLFYIARINFDIFYDSGLVSRFAPHKPYKCINDLATDAEVIIAEVDHILDYPRPTLPNTKLIGGSSASPAKPLDGEFKKFVDKSTNGIIVFTFGGSLLDIPPHISSKFISAFKQLDLDVVWKVNITSPDPSRIMTSKWIPQNDLLGHMKTRLFISHCGKNGQYEALYHGVPILCLPIFGDQGYNAERIMIKGLGLGTDMREASADELAAMMKQIVYEGNYTQNIKKASHLYRELYKVPKKEAAYWFDHVMQHGGAYMRSAGQQMPWYQIYVLDVIAFLLGILIVIALIVYSLIVYCHKLYRMSQTKVKPKKH